MIIDIKEIDGDVHISGNVITINHGKIVLSDGTVICSGLEESVTPAPARPEQMNGGSATVPPPAGNAMAMPTGMPQAEQPGQPVANADVLSEEFEVGSFDTLTVRSVFNVDYETGETSRVLVEAAKDVLEQVLVETNGRGLTIDFRPGYIVDTVCVHVKVVSPRLSQIISYGGSVVNINSPLNTDSTLMLSAHNASKINAKTLAGKSVYLSSDQAGQLFVESVSASMAVISKCIEASQLHVTGNAYTRNVFVTADQASRVIFSNITTESLVCKTSGTARAVLTGSARKVEYGASHQSEINAKDLSAESGKAVGSEIASIFSNVHSHFDSRATMNSKIVNSNK